MINNIFKKNLFFLIGIGFILLVWFFAAEIINNELIIPRMINVFFNLCTLLKSINTYTVILNTIFSLAITVIFSFIISLVLSLLSWFYNYFEKAIRPPMIMMKTTPVAAIIVILLLMFGRVYSPYIITSFVIIPIMYEGFLNGFQSIDNNIIDEISLLTNRKFKIICKIYLPITARAILSSLMQSIGLGLKVMVMAEFIAQPTDTIGFKLLHASLMMDTKAVFSWTIILMIFVFLFEIIIKNLKNQLQK